MSDFVLLGALTLFKLFEKKKYVNTFNWCSSVMLSVFLMHSKKSGHHSKAWLLKLQSKANGSTDIQYLLEKICALRGHSQTV